MKISGLCTALWLGGCLLLACNAAQAQDAPDAPAPQNPGDTQSTSAPQQPNDGKSNEEKKQSEEHTENAAERTVHMTVEAAEVSRKLGEKALVKARNWEASWLTGVFVEQGQVMTPLNSAQRRELYLQQTLTTPGAYMKRLLQAGFDQWEETPPEWNEHWSGYFQRFASREGQFITANSLAALGNAKLRYEPRYDQCQCHGFRKRTLHAIMRNFMTYDYSEENLRPQLALYGGAFGGGLLSAAWKPHPRNAFAEGARGMLGQAEWGTVLNFFIEFGGDINRKLGAKRTKGNAAGPVP